jgi:uncharacterized protein (DUF4415 family)
VSDPILKRYQAADLEQMARKESRSDMARIRHMTETELEKSISTDADWNDVPPDWHLKAQAVMPEPKKLLSLRLDADVIDWFKQQGAGYQTRMNAVLRSFMEHEAGRRSR